MLDYKFYKSCEIQKISQFFFLFVKTLKNFILISPPYSFSSFPLVCKLKLSEKMQEEESSFVHR